MDIEIIRERVRVGTYLIKSHAVQHALKEGFERKHMVEAALDGAVIEEYPEAQRVLLSGKTSLSKALTSTCTLFVNSLIQFTSSW